jgi:hypothetical protein
MLASLDQPFSSNLNSIRQERHMLIFIYSDNHVFSSENLMSDFAYTHSDSELIYTLTSKPIKKPKKTLYKQLLHSL